MTIYKTTGCLCAALVLACAGAHGTEVYLTTTGGPSMLPALPFERVPVVMEPAPFDELRRGDVVMYRNARGGLTTHRLIRKTWRGGWIVQGDANRFPDSELVTRENYRGRLALVLDGRGPVRIARSQSATATQTR